MTPNNFQNRMRSRKGMKVANELDKTADAAHYALARAHPDSVAARHLRKIRDESRSLARCIGWLAAWAWYTPDEEKPR